MCESISQLISRLYCLESDLNHLHEVFWQVDAMDDWIFRICLSVQLALSGLMIKIFKLVTHMCRLNNFLT